MMTSVGHKATHTRKDFRPVDKAERVVVAERNSKLDYMMDVALGEDDFHERVKFPDRESEGPVGEQLSLVA